MNNAGNHNTPWSDTDIRKYLKGELSAREMHDLEKAALDDPFLADALEGLETTPSHEADMDQLRSRLDARMEKRDEARVVAWWRRPAPRIAAAAVLLVGIGLTTITYFTTGKSKLNVDIDVVKQSTRPAPAQPPAKSAAANADSTVMALDTTASQYYANNDKKRATKVEVESQLARNADHEREPASRPTRRAEVPKIARTADSIAPPSIEARSAGSLAVVEIRKPAKTPAAEDRATAPVAATRDADAFAKINTPAFDTLRYDTDKAKELKKGYYGNNKPLTFSGRVVDVNNRPLAGALLSVNGYSNVGAKTDAYGNFKFRMRPVDSAQQMTIALNGYKLANVSLNINALGNNIYQLQPSPPQLNEVVVTGYGTRRKETLAAAPLDDNNERLDSVWLRVYPITGKLAYQEYLDSAKKALRLDSAIHGQERVSFQVDQKGQISEFKIEQSLSPAHDAGVIQIINGGPAWKLLRGKKARALVILNFP